MKIRFDCHVTLSQRELDGSCTISADERAFFTNVLKARWNDRVWHTERGVYRKVGVVARAVRECPRETWLFTGAVENFLRPDEFFQFFKEIIVVSPYPELSRWDKGYYDPQTIQREISARLQRATFSVVAKDGEG